MHTLMKTDQEFYLCTYFEVLLSVQSTQASENTRILESKGCANIGPVNSKDDKLATNLTSSSCVSHNHYNKKCTQIANWLKKYQGP